MTLYSWLGLSVDRSICRESHLEAIFTENS